MATLPEPPEGYRRTHITWDGGWMEFDACMSQNLDFDGEVTEHPVDTGAAIADHYRRKNLPIILEVEITNTPIREPLTHTDGSTAIQSVQTIQIDSPIFPGAPTNLFGVDITTSRAVQISTLNFEPAMNRMQAVMKELDAIQTEVRLLTVVVSGIDTFDDMLLKRFTIDRDNMAGSSMNLTLELYRVPFAVALEDVQVELPKKPRSTKKSDKGKQGTTETTSQDSRLQSVLFQASS